MANCPALKRGAKFGRPSGAARFPTSPTACAVGYILTPLRGW